MKKLLVAISITVLAVLLLYTSPKATAATATITLLNELPTSIPLGGSYTIDILVESDEPFILTLAQAAPYFPAYVHDHGGDRATHATSAVLHLTLFGARSTADLPGGVTAVDAVVGVIFHGGVTVSQRFPFEVAVVEK